MSNDEIKELIQLVVESGIAELEMQRGEDRVRIRRTIESARRGSFRAGHDRRDRAAQSPRHRRLAGRTNTSSNRQSSAPITTRPSPAIRLS